jgi:hypothetical protein
MELIKKHFKKFLVIFFLLSFFSAYGTGYFVAQPKKGGVHVFSQGLIVVSGDPLHIEVVPNGYPVVGESWTIFVYNYSLSSGQWALKACPNASVLVTVKAGDCPQSYNLSVNDNGQTTFPYLSHYSDVAFQAFRGESDSDKKVISEHYVSSDIINRLSAGNFLVLTVSILSLAISRNKIGRKIKLLSFTIICLFAFVTITSLFSYTQVTVWGYPEKIIGSLVTVSFLWNILIAGSVFLLIFIGCIVFSVKKK